MKYKISYVINVWATSAIVGSILLFCFSYFFDPSVVTNGGSISDTLGVYVVIMAISLLFSIPALALLWLAVYLLTKTQFNLWLIKLLLALVCLILCVFTLCIFPQFQFSNGDLMILGSYSIPLVASVFFYRLR
jgi:hypothetical protein